MSIHFDRRAFYAFLVLLLFAVGCAPLAPTAEIPTVVPNLNIVTVAPPMIVPVSLNNAGGAVKLGEVPAQSLSLDGLLACVTHKGSSPDWMNVTAAMNLPADQFGYANATECGDPNESGNNDNAKLGEAPATSLSLDGNSACVAHKNDSPDWVNLTAAVNLPARNFSYADATRCPSEVVTTGDNNPDDAIKLGEPPATSLSQDGNFACVSHDQGKDPTWVNLTAAMNLPAHVFSYASATDCGDQTNNGNDDNAKLGEPPATSLSTDGKSACVAQKNDESPDWVNLTAAVNLPAKNFSYMDATRCSSEGETTDDNSSGGAVKLGEVPAQSLSADGQLACVTHKGSSPDWMNVTAAMNLPADQFGYANATECGDPNAGGGTSKLGPAPDWAMNTTRTDACVSNPDGSSPKWVNANAAAERPTKNNAYALASACTGTVVIVPSPTPIPPTVTAILPSPTNAVVFTATVGVEVSATPQTLPTNTAVSQPTARPIPAKPAGVCHGDNYISPDDSQYGGHVGHGDTGPVFNEALWGWVCSK